MRTLASSQGHSEANLAQLPPKNQSISLGVYPLRRGLAEELGAVDPCGRGFSLDRFSDVGMDVSGWWESIDAERRPGGSTSFPPGHHFFPDCLRETKARMIQYSMTRGDIAPWFVTQTFREYVSERKAYTMLRTWLQRLDQAHGAIAPRGQRLKWIVAQEWQRRHVIHFHLILLGVRLGDLSRKRWESRWEGIGGGYARIHDAVLSAAPYLAKYCGKDQGGDLRWEGAWRGIEFPGSTACCRA